MKLKIGRVQFVKPVNVPHYNTFEGITWKDHRHELDLVFDDGILIVRGMPERLKGRMVEVMVPESNIAGMMSLEAELEWSQEDERRREAFATREAAARSEAEEAERQRQEGNKAREDARSQPRSSDEGVVTEFSGKKKAKRGGRPKASKGVGKFKG